MQIIRPRKRIITTTYSLRFLDANNKPEPLAFPCEQDGSVNLVLLSDGARLNLGSALQDLNLTPYVESHTAHYTQPAVGACVVCGNAVVLDWSTNTCEHCKTDYNISGTKLMPRSEWGEETGETLADILR